MAKYPKLLADLSEKELAELNFTAILYLHSKIDRIEGCLEYLCKQNDINYFKLDKSALHLPDIYKKIDDLLDNVESTILSDIQEKRKSTNS